MLLKICRLCPNSAQWRRPTPKLHENKKAYTGQHGFGFEEWLNRDEWLLSGYKGSSGAYRYAHIQGLTTKNNAYVNQDVRILFYVKEYGNNPQAVAVLEHGRVIDEAEATWAAKKIVKNNWLQLMHAEVKSIGASTKGLPPLPEGSTLLTWENPLYYANIKFLPEHLHFLEPRRRIHISSYYYSTALDWDGVIPEEIDPLPPLEVPDVEGGTGREERVDRFSEQIIKHKEIAGKEFSPRQAPIQNSLARQLKKFYAPKNGIVTCENDRVDIKLITHDGLATFIEIKPASSARQAIRQAIGQLLEYAHYSEEDRADKLVIVSDARPEDEDLRYLDHLMRTYHLGISYVYCPADTVLTPDILASFAASQAHPQ